MNHHAISWTSTRGRRVGHAMSQLNICEDCGTNELEEELLLVVADVGYGAFIAILCPVCWHRRQYRAELERRIRERKLGGQP